MFSVPPLYRISTGFCKNHTRDLICLRTRPLARSNGLDSPFAAVRIVCYTLRAGCVSTQMSAVYHHDLLCGPEYLSILACSQWRL